MDSFAKTLCDCAFKYKRLVLLDVRPWPMYKLEFSKAFSDRYILLNEGMDVAVARGMGLALDEYIPVVLGESSDFLKAVHLLQKTFLNGTLNLKMVGIGDAHVSDMMRKITGLSVTTEWDETFLSDYGPAYLHLL